MTLLITEADIERIFCLRDAIPITEECFRLEGQGLAENPPRFRMPFERGFLQFGSAALPTRKVLGFKMWANFGSPLTGTLNFLYSMETGELLAIIQSHLISKLRTAATTAVAARYLSRENAASIGMYGAGRQAGAQLEALCEVRGIQSVKVYSRRVDRLQRFCSEMSRTLDIPVVAARAPDEVARDADIVVTVTNSKTPVLRGDWLTEPCFVAATGANHWYKREIDEDVVRRAGRIFVDQKDHSKVESGDLLWPIGQGLLSWNHVAELGAVVAGREHVEPNDHGVVLFESHGLAIEDVAISAVAYERATSMGLGRQVDLWPEDSMSTGENSEAVS